MERTKKGDILSSRQYQRLSDAEKETYIQRLFDEIVDDEICSDNEDVEGEEVEVASEAVISDIEEAEEDDICDDALEIEEDDYEEMDTEDEPVNIDLNAVDFVARDGTIWSSKPRPARQAKQRNIVRQRSGPVRSTSTMSIVNTFKCYMSAEMVDIITRHTNKKAMATYAAFNAEHPEAQPRTWKEVTLSEMYAIIGVLIMTGANRSGGERVTDLWSIESYPLYRATMGINRFQAILRFIRFDDSNTRAIRQKTDKAAPISELWTMMNSNLENFYKPSEYITVDEQLFPYRGRTRFTQYIPSKPAKYGIKVWWVCDAKNSYPLHGQIYTGQAVTGRESNQGERVVKDLVSRYNGSGRNITMDNFFTTLNLFQNLNSMNLTAVGTVRKNKAFIPKEMLPQKDRPVESTVFGFMSDISICSYVPKKNKAVVLLSSMHDDDAIGTSGKPEIIEFYNQTKGGVDVMDQLLGEYSCQRQTKRWPLSLFFNMIDLTALAAYIIFYENNPHIKYTNLRRKRFLRQLAKELCMPLIEERSVNPQVMRNFSAKVAIAAYINTVTPERGYSTASTSAGVRGQKPQVGSCYLCYIHDQHRRRTRNMCSVCKRPICMEHSENHFLCDNCKNSETN